MEDIVIVGAGPAGLTAAIYTQRAGRHAVVFEEKTYGGQIVNAGCVENYPAVKNISGYDFATNLYEQAISLGAEVRFEKVIGLKRENQALVVKTNSKKYKAKAVIIATGAINKSLGVKNEEKFIGKGISYCATCDGAFFKGKDVAVVGGGNTALEDALYLTQFCRKVYVIHRRDEFRGEANYVDELKTKKNVKFLLNSTITKILGDETLNKIEISNNGKKETLNIAGLFVAVGHMPNNEEFRDIITLNRYGYIKAKEDCHTNIKNVYVAGDARTKNIRQLSTACADGAVAALTACSETK